MIRMKDSPHFRSLSRLGCQGDTAAGLLRILDQEGKADSDFASRAGGVEQIRNTNLKINIKHRAVVRDADDDAGILLFYGQPYLRSIRPDTVCGDIGDMER